MVEEQASLLKLMFQNYKDRIEANVCPLDKCNIQFPSLLECLFRILVSLCFDGVLLCDFMHNSNVYSKSNNHHIGNILTEDIRYLVTSEENVPSNRSVPKYGMVSEPPDTARNVCRVILFERQQQRPCKAMASSLRTSYLLVEERESSLQQERLLLPMWFWLWSQTVICIALCENGPPGSD